MNYSLDKVLEESTSIIKANYQDKYPNFYSYVNSREYELEITRVASSIVITKQIYQELLLEVKNQFKVNKELSFTIFFILCTMCRRQNYGDLLSLVIEYEDDFEDYEITKHIKLMAILDKSSHSSTLYKAIKESNKMVELKNDVADFTHHTGVLNVYTALICKYFEYNLDERDENANKELLTKALRCIKKVIEIEKEEKGSYDLVYSKFYLNYGRILILLGKYTKGEEEIQKAINLIPESNDRMAKVNEYNQYLLKASIIHSYDLNEEKNKDLEKVKVNNYKSIALMTTLLGFLLGAINIFTEVKDTYTLAMLMLCYFGLLLVLIGLVLFGLTISLKDKKPIDFVYDIALVIVGALIFGITIAIIL